MPDVLLIPAEQSARPLHSLTSLRQNETTPEVYRRFAGSATVPPSPGISGRTESSFRPRHKPSKDVYEGIAEVVVEPAVEEGVDTRGAHGQRSQS